MHLKLLLLRADCERRGRRPRRSARVGVFENRRKFEMPDDNLILKEKI